MQVQGAESSRVVQCFQFHDADLVPSGVSRSFRFGSDCTRGRTAQGRRDCRGALPEVPQRVGPHERPFAGIGRGCAKRRAARTGDRAGQTGREPGGADDLRRKTRREAENAAAGCAALRGGGGGDPRLDRARCGLAGSSGGRHWKVGAVVAPTADPSLRFHGRTHAGGAMPSTPSWRQRWRKRS